jgi:hypothetical protein
MEIFTKNSAKCTVFQSTICNKFSSLMYQPHQPGVASYNQLYPSCLINCCMTADESGLSDEQGSKINAWRQRIL